MATVPPILKYDDEGNLVSYINRDPRLVNPLKCVHEPAEGSPYICMCVHDWSIAGAVGSLNAETGADEYWGPLPLPTDQTGIAQ